MSLGTVIETHTQKVREKGITFEKFLKKYEGQHCEWVNGRVIQLSPIHDLHEDICVWLKGILAAYVRNKRLGRVVGDPYLFKLSHHLPARCPDIAFNRTATLSRMSGNFFDGCPDLAIEIISPDSRRRDRVTKLREYEQAGVLEYWIIDPHNKKIEFYVRNDQGKFERVLVGGNEIYQCTVIEEFWIKPEWLWQNPLPNEYNVARELGQIP